MTKVKIDLNDEAYIADKYMMSDLLQDWDAAFDSDLKVEALDDMVFIITGEGTEAEILEEVRNIIKAEEAR